MSLRSQIKPPPASRSPSTKKENLDELPVDKRRRIAVGKMVGPARARSVLSALNAGANHGDSAAAAVSTDAGSSGGRMEFGSREDVERLLAEKMKGKSKNDYKGKSEQMIEYIKKLRICTRWYIELEDGYLAEQEKLRSMYEAEEKRRAEIETQMSNKVEELDTMIQEIRQQYGTLLVSFRKEEADKLAILEAYEEEKELRVAAESSRAALAEELERVSHDAKRFGDQLKMVQDTNKRLQEYNTSLQQYNSNLQADVVKNGEAISKLQKEKSAMMETLASLRDHANSVKNQLESSRSSQQEAIRQKEELTKEVGCLRSELRQVRDDRDHSLAQVQSLSVEVANYKELSGKSLKDLDILITKTTALELADITAIEAVTTNEKQKRTVKDLQDRLSDAEFQISEGEKLRKKLHNTILELKGNIRVFCRVRPVLGYSDCSEKEGAVVSYPTALEFAGRGIDLTNNAQKYSFTFDKVFNHEASQEDVFIEISQLVQSALDGYKVCIFAYGQTGSGKTYTMMGKPEPQQKGLIPRSLEQIFQTSQSLQSQGWSYKMQASMLEIYNETVRDLLVPGRSGTLDANGSASKQYAIKHDLSGNTHVAELTIVDVYSIKDVSFLLNQAMQSRSVGRTQMNEESSRSHFVFTLRISGVNTSTEQQVQGVLNLIDLAGSERLAKSGSTGDRLKETQAINKSLSALSDVIFSIAKKEDHVPFRNSKLTYLLQPCLGGDSKTLMFVNIAPEVSSVGESLCSLRFAARVNSCEIGIPRRQTQMRSFDSRLSYG
uniref:Kinesin-like protein n=1 Tax=Ananas comosus var. bracteatus TaxID=296719 RepID=A0A6V7QUD3_ANACO